MRKVGQFLLLFAAPLLFGESDNALAASRRATPVAAQQSTWNHNGSVVSLIARGERLRIVYQTPRVGLLDAGVKPGMVLFEGQRNKLSFSGIAYMFYRTCKPQAYAVSGDINENASQITLKGKAPLLDLNCNNTGSRDDLLIFTAAQPGEPPKSEQLAVGPGAPPAPVKTPALSEEAKAANASAAPVVNATVEKPGAVPTDGGAVDALAAAKKSEEAKAKAEAPASGSASAAKEPPSAEPAKTAATTAPKAEKTGAPPAEPAKTAAANEPKTEKTETPPAPPAKDDKKQAGSTTQLASLPQDNAGAAAKESGKTGAGIDKGSDGEKQKVQPPAAETAPAAPPVEQKEIKTAAIPPAPPAEPKSDDAGKSKNAAADKTPAASASPPPPAKSNAASNDGKTSPLMAGQEKMMEIVLKNGRILRVGRDMDLDALSRLIAMLEKQE